MSTVFLISGVFGVFGAIISLIAAFRIFRNALDDIDIPGGGSFVLAGIFVGGLVLFVSFAFAMMALDGFMRLFP